MERRRQQPELSMCPALTLLHRGRDDGEFLKQAGGITGEAAVDDVDVFDGTPAHHQREAHVPVCLEAAAEDGDDLDIVAAYE